MFSRDGLLLCIYLFILIPFGAATTVNTYAGLRTKNVLLFFSAEKTDLVITKNSSFRVGFPVRSRS